MDKNFKKNLLEELHITLYQRGYPATLINKGFELAEKIPQGGLKNLKKHYNLKSLAYVANYNKNNPEIFTEII